MIDLKQQILKELASLEDRAFKLRAVATNAEKQTDLEVAILTSQVKSLREKNTRASDLVEKSISLLKILK